MEAIYEKADALAAAVKDCEDYKALLAAGEKLEQEAATRIHVRDYLVLQAKLAYAQSMGDKPVKKKLKNSTGWRKSLKQAYGHGIFTGI